MRLVHYYRTAGGYPSGVTSALSGWINATSSIGISAIVLYDGKLGHRDYSCETRSLRHAGRGRQTSIPIGLSGELRDGDILVLHEGWVSANLIAAKIARRRRLPYIVMPHGAYEPAIRADLKGPVGFRQQCEANLLDNALFVHNFFATEDFLVRDVARLARTFAIPSGVNIPKSSWAPKGSYIAWMGRYAIEHKGLDLLLAALAKIPADERPFLRIRGYDYQGGLAEIHRLVRSLGIQKSVEVGGRVDGQAKEDFLLGAAAYVHPARWEAHSIALMEALSLGVPCIVSSSMHVASLLHDADAARVVDLATNDLSESLVRARALDYLGAKGRSACSELFNWTKAASDLRDAILQNLSAKQ
jgi:glycosyltransferase involved in cell wall biosynthesis